MWRKTFTWMAAGLLLGSSSLAVAYGQGGHFGTVLETMNSGGYTYIKVDEGGVVYWAAAPEAKVAVGDNVSFTEQMKMEHFSSSTLNRTFDQIMFVNELKTSTMGSSSAPDAVESAESIAKADGGYTVEEIYARKEELKGKTVKVRGKVVKVSQNIMGNNWVHLQDGTGAAGSNKIIFRSETEFADVGTVTTAEGTLDTDKDFGYGYRYQVLVERSTFSK